MKTQSHIELTSDELDNVTGGMDTATKTSIMNVLALIPVVGTLTQTGRAIANAMNLYHGYPLI